LKVVLWLIGQGLLPEQSGKYDEWIEFIFIEGLIFLSA